MNTAELVQNFARLSYASQTEILDKAEALGYDVSEMRPLVEMNRPEIKEQLLQKSFTAAWNQHHTEINCEDKANCGRHQYHS